MLRRLLVVFGLAATACTPQQDSQYADGRLADVPTYIDAAMRPPAGQSALVINVLGSDDFLQLTGTSESVQFSFPLITDRQKEWEPRIRAAAMQAGIPLVEVSGSGGHAFLDADIRGSSELATKIARQFLTELYRVDEQTLLSFACHGCGSP